MTWHVGIDLMRAYAADALGPPAAASVEVHVTSCAQCRALARDVVADESSSETLSQAWATIRLTTTALPQPRLARSLRRLGVPESDVVLIGGFTGLPITWALSVGAAIVCAVVGVGIQADRQVFYYLAVAPLIPVLAVAVAFDALDPLR
ncbi:MAG TPA: zf-HC2 domain-containing protein, partial [Humibacillus sp.]|nr:zf-HC2 domain-containing protein [Humibacillus sp.]